MDPEDVTNIAAAFGPDVAAQAEGVEAVEQLAGALGTLIEMCQGDDDGGPTRVGYVLIVLGGRLAGMSPGELIRIPHA